MKKSKTVLLIVPYIISAAFLIFMRDKAYSGAYRGVSLCLWGVIPSVLPFAVLTKYFYYSADAERVACLIGKRLCRMLGATQNAAVIILLGCISGYPTSAALCARMYEEGKITASEACRLASFTNNATPAFVISFVGVGAFGSIKIGVAMYICLMLSSLIYGAVISPHTAVGDTVCFCRKTSRADAFTKAVTSSMPSILNACGYVIVFSVVGSALECFVKNGYLRCIMLLLLELSVGVSCICEYVTYTPACFALVTSLVSLSGLCAMVQVSSQLAACGLGAGEYVKGKAVQFFITFVLSFLVFSIFFA